MSDYTQTSAACDIAAAYVAVPMRPATGVATSPIRHRNTAIGLINAEFGKGHPPRERTL